MTGVTSQRLPDITPELGADIVAHIQAHCPEGMNAVESEKEHSKSPVMIGMKVTFVILLVFVLVIAVFFGIMWWLLKDFKLF